MITRFSALRWRCIEFSPDFFASRFVSRDLATLDFSSLHSDEPPPPFWLYEPRPSHQPATARQPLRHITAIAAPAVDFFDVSLIFRLPRDFSFSSRSLSPKPIELADAG